MFVRIRLPIEMSVRRDVSDLHFSRALSLGLGVLRIFQRSYLVLHVLEFRKGCQRGLITRVVVGFVV